jgi:hypothetical protein
MTLPAPLQKEAHGNDEYDDDENGSNTVLARSGNLEPVTQLNDYRFAAVGIHAHLSVKNARCKIKTHASAE